MYKTQKIIAIGIMAVLLMTSISVVIRGDDPPSEGNGSQTYEYVIITSDELKNSNLYGRYYRDYPELEDSYPLPSNGFSFQALRDSRIARGLTATIVTIEEIISNPDYGVNGKWGDNNPVNPFYEHDITGSCELFNDTQAKIRNFIRFANKEWSTKYVLLGGTNDILPARNLYFGAAELYYNGMPSAYVQYLVWYYTDWEPDYNLDTGNVTNWDEINTSAFPRFSTDVFGPSDLYYGCLNGSFNYDMDDRWGESASDNDLAEIDEADLYAEVYVGRAPASGWREVSHFVRKTLIYESSEGDPYLQNMLMVGQLLAKAASDHCHVDRDLWGGTILDGFIDEAIDLTGTLEGKYGAIPVDPVGFEYTQCGRLKYLPAPRKIPATTDPVIPLDEYSIFSLYDRDSQNYGEYVWPHNPNWGWKKSDLMRWINHVGFSIINNLGSTIDYLSHGPPIFRHFMKMRYPVIDNLDNPDILNNNNKYFFIYSQDCFAGAYDGCLPFNLHLDKDFEQNPPVVKPARTIIAPVQGWLCPAEYLTTGVHGAVAAIMNARHGFTHPNCHPSYDYNQEFWRTVFEDGIHEFSKANQLSKENLADQIDEPCMRFGYYGLNYFGDPALSLMPSPGVPKPPTKPNQPCGQTFGKPGVAYTYTTSATDPNGDQLYYRWDWHGDLYTDVSEWFGPYDSGEICEVSHIWEDTGNEYETYDVRVIAKDDCSITEWSDTLTLTIDNLLDYRPSIPCKPEGPTQGTTGTWYMYNTSTTDPNDDNVRYGWDWNGNDVVDEWTEFYPSGATASTSHLFPRTKFPVVRTYNVQVKAKDENDIQSAFSSALTVVISGPNTPCDPIPNDNAIVELDYMDSTLNWNCSYQTGDPLLYDVYFTTDYESITCGYELPDPDKPINPIISLFPDPSALISSNQSDKTCDPGPLDYSTKYYWRIVAKYNNDWPMWSIGPIWCFTTAAPNQPPNTPIRPRGPIAGTTGISYTYFTWTVDSNNDSVMFGWDWDGDDVVDEWTDMIEAQNTTCSEIDGRTVCPKPGLVNTSHVWDTPGTYNVQVMAEDEHGAQSEFSIALTVVITLRNQPPVVSDIPDQIINVDESFTTINLDDYVSDPDNSDSDMTWTVEGNEIIQIDIFPLGTGGGNPPVNDLYYQAFISYPDGWIGNETVTFTATDPDGLSDFDSAAFTVSALAENIPPIISSESPADDAVDVTICLPELSVTIDDPEDDLFGWSIETVPDIGSNGDSDDTDGIKTLDLPTCLEYDTTYTWYVNATDVGSGQTTSEIFTFTTQTCPGINHEPNKPTSPSPADTSTGVDILPMLSVLVSDPDYDTLNVSFYLDDVLIGTNEDIASGSISTFTLTSALEYNTTYTWYVVVNDSEYENTSDIWTFKTMEEPLPVPTVNITKPIEGKLYFRNSELFSLARSIIIGYIEIIAEVDDPGSVVETVKFFIDDDIVYSEEYNASNTTYKYLWNEQLIGFYTIKVALYDSSDFEVASDTVDVFVLNLGIGKASMES